MCMDHLHSKCKCHTVGIYCQIWDFGIENGISSQVLALSHLISPCFAYFFSPFFPNFSIILFCYAFLVLACAITLPVLWLPSSVISPLLSMATPDAHVTCLLYFFSVLCSFLNISASFSAVRHLPVLFSVRLLLFLPWHPANQI